MCCYNSSFLFLSSFEKVSWGSKNNPFFFLRQNKNDLLGVSPVTYFEFTTFAGIYGSFLCSLFRGLANIGVIVLRNISVSVSVVSAPSGLSSRLFIWEGM